MGKVGKYEYPDLELSEAVAKAEQIHVDYSDKTSAGNLAKIFGISARGGAFPVKVNDLKAYGLIEGERGDFRLTPLALRIVQHDLKARGEAFLKIPLFEAIHEEFHGALPDNMEVFKNRLKDLVKPVSDKAVSIRAARLRNRYTEALPYLMPQSSKTSGEKDMATKPSTQSQGLMPELTGEHVIPSDYAILEMEGFVVGARKDVKSLELLEDGVKSWVALWKKQLSPRTKPRSNDKKTIEKKSPTEDKAAPVILKAKPPPHP